MGSLSVQLSTPLLVGALCSACAAARIATDEVLAAELRQDVPEASDQILIPFAIDEKWVKKARTRLLFTRSTTSQAQALIDGLDDPDLFGVMYREGFSLTANEALEAREGNCYSYAAILVGVARALGMRAEFGEYDPNQDLQVRRGSMHVRSGHITGVIATKDGYVAMEYGHGVDRRHWRVITDREAVAHYYNNRGFMRLSKADARELELPWTEAAKDFRIATTLVPSFHRGLNNLGVAMSRLGREREALTYYRLAIAHEPRSSATHLNLGALLLRRGRVREAAISLRRAAELEPDDIRVRRLLERTLAVHDTH